MVNRPYSFRFDSTFALAQARLRGYGGFLYISFFFSREYETGISLGRSLKGSMDGETSRCLFQGAYGFVLLPAAPRKARRARCFEEMS
jgi:hypothetical protein